MGMRGWLKRTFSAPSGKQASAEAGGERHDFSYGHTSLPYSLLIKGMFGQEPNGRILSGRADAMRIPAILRGRNLICNIATLPLESVGPDNRVRRNPLLDQIDPNVANVVTLAQTVEDLFFDSVAWWRVTGFDPVTGMPSRAKRYSPDQVSLQPPAGYAHGWLPSGLSTTGVVWMEGKAVPWSEVIRFDSPNPPFMQMAEDAIERAVLLDAAAKMYATDPSPRSYFSPADGLSDPFEGEDLTDEEKDQRIAALLDDWAAARRSRSTAYVPAALKYNTVQSPTPAELQLVALQQRVSLELANAIGLDPEDLGISTTSRTYQNATDRRKDRINDVLSPYMAAITQRLTMPDVTLPGERVRFRLDDYLRADPKTRAEVNSTYLDKGVISRQWVAADEGLPPEAIPAEPARPAIQAGQVSTGSPLAESGGAESESQIFAAYEAEVTL
jgi:hypothetical protein